MIGANRRYIEQTIPHISSLMVASVAEVVAASEVLIVSKKNKEFQELLANIPPEITVIDLVRIIEHPEKKFCKLRGHLLVRAPLLVLKSLCLNLLAGY